MLELLPPTVRLRDHRSGAELGHAALVASVARRAAAFAKAGLGISANVVIGHGEGSGFIVDLLAAWQIGAVVVAVPPSLTVGERLRVAVATRPALWIGAEETAGVRWLRPEAPAPDGTGPGRLALAAGVLDAPALVLMTSGTTSTPKGVVHSHRSLRARLALNLAHMGVHDLERSLAVLPMHFGHGLIGNCLTALAAGGSLTVWPDPGVDGFASLGQLIEDYGITFLSSVPSMWRVVIKASTPPRKRTLRRVHVGSAPLSVELWQAIADWCGTRRIFNMYGITETANWIGGHSLEDGPPADGLVGRPWGGVVRVRAEDGALSCEGEGEVAVSTPSLMTGYLDRPEMTAEVLHGGWFFTGDRGLIDGGGRLRVIGRRKHEINRAGIKIPAEEIDLLLERHPMIAEACAFPIDHPVAGEAIGVAVVPKDGAHLDVAEILAWCERNIRREAVPSRLFVIGALQRTERGKIDRDHVKAVVLGADEGGS
jgi:acyl-CoA synthetase (AMP-forming)/AMP-acid ligase II